jgi:hypothetical protein
MKIKAVSLIMFLMCLTSHAQQFKTPVDYLNFISKEQVTISKSTWNFIKAQAHSKSDRRINATRKTVIKNIQTVSQKISALKDGYNGDVEYRDQIVQYFSFLENYMNEDLGKIIDLQVAAEKSYDDMELYITANEMVEAKMNTENDKVNLAQKQFCAKYHITLTSEMDDLDKKMALSSEVFKYQSALYLIYFKCSITANKLSAAVNANDLGMIQQFGNSLISYSNEGLEKLKTIKPYNGDSTLLITCRKSLEAFQKSGTQFVPKIVDFLMFNEKFEAAKKTLDAKNDKDRTQEEVDNYNSLVKEANKQIDNYNKNNASNAEEINGVFANWDATSENFINSHVPND